MHKTADVYREERKAVVAIAEGCVDVSGDTAVITRCY